MLFGTGLTVTVRKHAIVRGTARHPQTPQINMVRAQGSDVIHVIDNKAPKANDVRKSRFEDAVRTFRPGDTVLLAYPYVIADPKRCKRGKVREYWDECMDAIVDRGPLVVDVGNSLRSDDKAQWRLMLKLGRAGAASSGKGVKSAENAKRGRKVTELAPEVEAAAMAIWLNRRDYPKWKDVEAALPKGVTIEYCYRTFKARTKRVKT
jgi:hypothetical protein